jgi:universal stress protein E
MDTLRHILVLVDPTAPDSPAVAKAARLAAAFRARLELLIVETVPGELARYFRDPVARTASLEARRASAEAVLESLAGRWRDAGLEVERRVEFGTPLHAGMLEAIRADTPDLVVKDTHHHAVLRRTVLGNTDWHLIRDCPAPLLLVKSRPWNAVPQVLAAVDPGHPNDEPALLDHALVEAGQRLARGLAGEFSLLHCWSPIELFAASAAGMDVTGVTIPIPREVVESVEQVDVARLGHLARVHDVPPARVHRVLGTAADELVTYPERAGTDVLVIGAVARSALAHAFVGSSAERVLEHAPCDLLVVKVPEGRAAAARPEACGARA